MATPTRTGLKKAKPILSLGAEDARRRVITLYKTWYRQVPEIVYQYDIPKSQEDCKKKIREEFRRHNDVKDIRVIDLLIIKGQMELQEVVNLWKPKSALMNYWKETCQPKPTDFMSKFLSGHDTTA